MPAPEDASDALAVAICHAHALPGIAAGAHKV
jgi:Holliday junction resolvasome RuvABC endonuclease subunit